LLFGKKIVRDDDVGVHIVTRPTLLPRRCASLSHQRVADIEILRQLKACGVDVRHLSHARELEEEKRAETQVEDSHSVAARGSSSMANHWRSS